MTNSLLGASSDPSLTAADAAIQDALADERQKDLAGNVAVNAEYDPAAVTGPPEGASLLPTTSFDQPALVTDTTDSGAVAATTPISSPSAPTLDVADGGGGGGALILPETSDPITALSGLASIPLLQDSQEALALGAPLSAPELSGLLADQAVSDNQAPLDEGEILSLAADSLLTGNLLANASDPDNDPLIITTFTVNGASFAAGQTTVIPDVGTIQIDANGDFVFTPAASYTGSVPPITYTVSDPTGATDSSTLTISVTAVDDTFTDADEVVSTPEDTAISGNVLSNGTPNPTGDGALSVTTFQVAGDGTVYTAGQTATMAGVGTLTIGSDGAYTFTPAANYNGPVPVATYVVSDGVGATDSSTLTISVTAVDDYPSTSGTFNVQLDDDALGGNSGGAGDANPDTANTSGVLGFNYGGDGVGSISYLTTGAPGGFVYEKNGSDLLIRQNGVTVITLTLNSATGAYTVTQNASVSHSPGAEENNQLFDVYYRVTDSNGDTADNKVSISVNDDMPVFTGSISNVRVGANADRVGDVDGVGAIPFSVGADSPAQASFLSWLQSPGAGSVITTTASQGGSGTGSYWFAETNLLSDGSKVFFKIMDSDPSLLIATKNPSGGPTDTVFTVDVNEVSKTYMVDMIRSVDLKTYYQVTGFSGKGGDSDSDYKYIYNDSAGTFYSSALPSGAVNLFTLYGTDNGNPAGLKSSNANNALAVGVGNNGQVSGAERLGIDVGPIGGDQKAYVTMDNPARVYVEFPGQSPASLNYSIYTAEAGRIDGTAVVLSASISGTTRYYIEISESSLDERTASDPLNNTYTFGKLELYQASSSDPTFRVSGVSMATGSLNQSIDVRFGFSISDSDQDKISGSFTITFDPGRDNTVLGPVAVDLNRDADVSYVSLSLSSDSGHIFQGSDLGVGWVSPLDGILAYDYNHDGLINEAREFVFTMWGSDPSVSTDMQALAAYFDSNHDGVFNSQDAAWNYFGVWQDLNSDGIQQGGEFYNLAHSGIKSIDLSYSEGSEAYHAAAGDVHVFGQMLVTYEDGTHGLAEDAAFAVQSIPVDSISSHPDGIDTSSDLTTSPVVEAVHHPDGLDASSDAAAMPVVDADHHFATHLAVDQRTYSVDDLVSTYLHAMTTSGDSDGNGDLSVPELAYGLDEVITHFIEDHSLSADDHSALQQEVLNSIADDLNHLHPGDHSTTELLQHGDANAADVLASLDSHFQEILDANAARHDIYHDLFVDHGHMG